MPGTTSKDAGVHDKELYQYWTGMFHVHSVYSQGVALRLSALSKLLLLWICVSLCALLALALSARCVHVSWWRGLLHLGLPVFWVGAVCCGMPEGRSRAFMQAVRVQPCSFSR